MNVIDLLAYRVIPLDESDGINGKHPIKDVYLGC